jgi:hypothetical protein
LKSVQKKFKNSLTHDSRFVILRSHTETNTSHMRTKTLLLTAALAAAGAATSMAQAVYSVNMVGYMNVSIPQGFSMVANHLNASPDNKVTTLLPAPPDNTTVSKFDRINGGYITITYIGGGVWEGDDLTMTLGPGEGGFIGTDAAFTPTFVGEVPIGVPVTVYRGFSIISSALPQTGRLDGAPPGLQFPVGENDSISRFDRVNGGYITDTFVAGNWEGDSGGPPQPALNEAFFFFNAGAADKTWNRTFTVAGP